MKLRACLLAAGLMLAASPALAEGAAGTWNASIDTPQGAVPLVFTFSVDGPKLSGSVANDMMGETPISNGTVDGDTLSFTLTMMDTMTINYEGVVEGDEMTLTSTFAGDPPPGAEAETTFTATRAE